MNDHFLAAKLKSSSPDLYAGVTFLDLLEVFLSKNGKMSENQSVNLAYPANY